MKRLLSLLGDMRSALLAFIFHPPPLAGGGKNSRQRIFGGWKKFGGLRRFSTPRDCAVAHSHPPPQAAEGKKHKRLSLFLLATMLSVNAAWAQAPVAPTVASESYILMDAETGTVLAEKNADLRLPPASLTKIMTAHLGFWALEQGVLQKEQEITVSRRAWAQKVEGSKTFLQVGGKVSVADLLSGIIVQSGNDASIALAEAIAGDEAAFAAEMNAHVKKLGLKNTRFANSTGLPAENHYSSARDVALLVQKTIADYPENYRLYSEREFTYNDIRQENRNTLLGDYPGADGVKTGYTKKAGYCLAASARRDGRRLISVVMKTNSAAARKRETIKLFNFGFGRFYNARLFNENKIRTMRVFKGAEDEVAAIPSRPGALTLAKGEKAEAMFVARRPLFAPIAKGEALGTIYITIDGEPAESAEVVAMEAVAEAGWSKRWLDMIKWKFLGHGDELFSEW